MNGHVTASRQVQFWMPIAMLSAGLLLLFVRSHLDLPIVRAALLPLAYGSFTLAMFEGVGVIRSLLAGQRRRG